MDYDRTLTHPETLAASSSALEALRSARARGVRVVVASGRGLDFLVDAVGAVADAIVAENGALLRLPDGMVVHLAKADEDLHRALAELGIPLETGRVILSFALADESRVQAALAARDADVVLVRNRDRVMLVPRGLDKAVGVAAALRALGLAPEQAVAFGDGENDALLLRSVGRGVAVANAASELKSLAHEVTELPGGEGVAAWVRAHVVQRRDLV